MRRVENNPQSPPSVRYRSLSRFSFIRRSFSRSVSRCCGLSRNDRIRSRLELIVRINADERSTVLTWDSVHLVNSYSRPCRRDTYVKRRISGKPKGNLPHRGIRHTHLSFYDSLAFDRRLLSPTKRIPCAIIACNLRLRFSKTL